MGISDHPTSSPNFFSIHTGICTCTLQFSIRFPLFEFLIQRTLIIICVADLSAETAQLLEGRLDNMTTCRASLTRRYLKMEDRIDYAELGSSVPASNLCHISFPIFDGNIGDM
jgi:hypothetical protein